MQTAMVATLAAAQSAIEQVDGNKLEVDALENLRSKLGAVALTDAAQHSTTLPRWQALQAHVDEWIASVSHDSPDEIADVAEHVVKNLPKFVYYSNYGNLDSEIPTSGHVPRDRWLLDEEKRKIIAFHERFPLEGYRRAGVHDGRPGHRRRQPVERVPRALRRRPARPLEQEAAQEGHRVRAFVQPLRAHEHWDIDVAYLNLAGTFYYLCSILDGASRAIVHWEIREAMTETDVECILQRAHEKYPNEKPRVISDNGPQCNPEAIRPALPASLLDSERIAPSSAHREALDGAKRAHCERHCEVFLITDRK